MVDLSGYDWEVIPAENPFYRTVIYELHVRASLNTDHQGSRRKCDALTPV